MPCYRIAFVAKLGIRKNILFFFDDPQLEDYIFIDTINNPNNIWQIGLSQKTFLSSSDVVMITDTLNSYPANDTSSFILKHVPDIGPDADFFRLVEVLWLIQTL